MRSYKRIMPIFLTAALLGSAAFAIHNRAQNKASYESELSEARYYADMGVVEDSIRHYQKALGMESSLEVYLEAGEVYLENGDLTGAQKWYSRVLKANYPKEAGTYLYGIRVYAASENYRDAFAAYHEYEGRGLYSDEVEEIMLPYRYMFTVSGNYQNAGVFGTSSGLAAVEYNDHWGYVDTKGKRKIPYEYDAAGLFGDYAPVIDRDGKAMYIDLSGEERINENFILEKDPDFGTVKEFQSIQSGLILAWNGQVWNYYDAETYEKRFGGYAAALPVVNGVGAVSMDGSTWALIGPDGTELTDYVFDAVLADGKGILCRNDVLITEVGGSCLLVDTAGTPVSAARYADAKAFNDTTMAAVKKDGKWIFVDAQGGEHDLGDYEEAESFSGGLAAVKQDGQWGYINTDGELVIECQFNEAGPFSTTGVAFVKTSPASWQLLSLYESNYR